MILSDIDRTVKCLLLRAYRNWDFPKGLMEAGEEPMAAALREVREETSLEELTFDWGPVFIETGPYNKGKIARYYIARSRETAVELRPNPELRRPEHHEARWVDYAQALTLVAPRLLPVVHWAYGLLHGHSAPPASGGAHAAG